MTTVTGITKSIHEKIEDLNFSAQARGENSAKTGVHPSDPTAAGVWTFRGYSLSPSDFNTAMVHLYRGEITRSNIWRQRLDTTTNWAVVTTGATITVAFNQTIGLHFVILLNALLITLFLFIEARRYLYYELWSYRIRLMETDFFAAMLVPPFHPASDWAESLAENMLQPDFPVSMWEGLGRRLRRNYLWIYLILGMAWIARVGLVPDPAATITHFIARAAIGGVPGELVIVWLFIFYGLLIATSLLTLGLHDASGEILPHFHAQHKKHSFGLHRDTTTRMAWYRYSKRRSQILTLIITDQAEAVSQRILKDMHRGVTALEGKGMYSGNNHAVLMCALTVTEVSQLKSLVREEDPKAFVIVTPAQDVLGEGFSPLASSRTAKPFSRNGGIS